MGIQSRIGKRVGGEEPVPMSRESLRARWSDVNPSAHFQRRCILKRMKPFGSVPTTLAMVLSGSR